MSLEAKSKKELISLINDLTEKLKEYKVVKDTTTSDVVNFKGKAFGAIFIEGQGYHLVKINYDLETKKAGIVELQRLVSNDSEMALYIGKKYLAETVCSPTNLKAFLKKG